MRALYVADQLRFGEQPDPVLDAGEVLLHVRLAGICHTDLELTRGYFNFQGILGHEFVAEVIEGEGWQPQQRVVGEINIACRQCPTCLSGVVSQCPQRRTLGIFNYQGTMADYCKLPSVNLYAVPDIVPDAWAVFTEPLAAALQITELVHIRPSDHVVLVGAGKLGLLCAQVLQHVGCDLTVLARRERPINLLKAWHIPVIDLRTEALPPAQRADIVVDCTGNADGFALALDLVRPRGTIVLKSTYTDLPVANLTRVVVDEIKVVGSRCGPFDAALRMMAAKYIDLDSMIEAIYALDSAVEAFEYAAQPGCLKVLLNPLVKRDGGAAQNPTT